jgi:ribosome-associated protein
MTEEKKEIHSGELVGMVVSALKDSKGIDIASIDFSKTANMIARFFVICHGNSNVHVSSLADRVIEKVRNEAGYKPWNREGFENAEWILLDYADVVVHIFQERTRKFYKLEELWADIPIKWHGTGE